MKRSTVFIALLFAISSAGYAQISVQDQHPSATISVIDYQSGTLLPAIGDQSILFKDAVIDLVVGTQLGKQLVERAEIDAPGDKRMVVNQMTQQQNGNAFEIVYTLFISDQTRKLFTFMYNADRNELFYYRADINNFEPVSVYGPNLYNLNNSKAYSRFNTSVNYPTYDAYAAPVDVNVTASAPPPPLPAYEQPECPTEGYLWQPGYWAYRPNGDGYYWVPGVWVAPPNNGLLWTPPYWGYEGNIFIFHAGYWGEHVGFYGGIYYGHGYQGSGFVGGQWRDNRFQYNTAVVRVNVVNVHNTYVNKTVINNVTINNYTSYNGGNGVKAKPTEDDIKVEHQQHVPPTKQQIVNQVTARQNPTQFAKSNSGKPTETALAKPPVVPVVKPAEPQGKTAAPPAGPIGNPAKPNVRNPGAVNTTMKPAAPANNATPVKPMVLGNNGVKPAQPANGSVKPVQPAGNGVRPVNPTQTHGLGDTSRKNRNQVKKPMPPRPPVKSDTSKKKS